MALVGSVGVLTVMVTFFGRSPFPPLVEIRGHLLASVFALAWLVASSFWLPLGWEFQERCC